MARDLKYGQIDIPGVPEDEPVFVLRAQDKFSIDAIQGYERIVNNEGEPEREWLISFNRVYDSFDQWQDANTDKVKHPD